jgi:hypothetical protein
MQIHSSFYFERCPCTIVFTNDRPGLTRQLADCVAYCRSPPSDTRMGDRDCRILLPFISYGLTASTLQMTHCSPRIFVLTSASCPLLWYRFEIAKYTFGQRGLTFIREEIITRSWYVCLRSNPKIINDFRTGKKVSLTGSFLNRTAL